MNRYLQSSGRSSADILAIGIEYLPGCEVVSIDDENLLGIGNGFIDALCGRHNQQRCRYYGQIPNLRVGDFVSVFYFPQSRTFLVLWEGGVGNLKVAGDFITWHNLWQAQTYFKNSMVIDELWVMIANKETTDRAAPQSSGTFTWLTEIPGLPSYTTETNAATISAELRPELCRYRC